MSTHGDSPRPSRRAIRAAERAAEREALLTGQQPLLTRREMRRLREEAEALRRAVEAGELTPEQAKALQNPLATPPVVPVVHIEATGSHARVDAPVVQTPAPVTPPSAAPTPVTGESTPTAASPDELESTMAVSAAELFGGDAGEADKADKTQEASAAEAAADAAPVVPRRRSLHKRLAAATQDERTDRQTGDRAGHQDDQAAENADGHAAAHAGRGSHAAAVREPEAITGSFPPVAPVTRPLVDLPDLGGVTAVHPTTGEILAVEAETVASPAAAAPGAATPASTPAVTTPTAATPADTTLSAAHSAHSADASGAESSTVQDASADTSHADAAAEREELPPGVAPAEDTAQADDSADFDGTDVPKWHALTSEMAAVSAVSAADFGPAPMVDEEPAHSRVLMIALIVLVALLIVGALVWFVMTNGDSSQASALVQQWAEHYRVLLA